VQSISALPEIEASAFGADTSIDPTAALNAAAQSVPDSGGTLELTAGKVYDLTGPLVLKSNTILEGNGATLLDAVPISVDSSGFALVTNENFGASTLTDHNITVDNLNLDYASVDGGGSHAISFREASNVTVENSTFHGGNDATALLATDDTLVTGCTAFNITNVAYDQWEGASDAIVSNNVAYLTGTGSYGILFTGVGTTPDDQQSATNEIASNNTIYNAGQAGIWVCALSPDSSVSDVIIAENQIDGENAGGAGVGVSGAGAGFLIEQNSISGISQNNAIFVRPDHWNSPAGADILGNAISGCTTSDAEVAAIQALGNNIEVANNQVAGGQMPALVWVDGSGDVVANNVGPTDIVNTTGASDLTIFSTGFPETTSQSQLAGDSHVGMNAMSGTAYFDDADESLGGQSEISLDRDDNSVLGGDANFHISSSGSANKIEVGDGNNTIDVGGTLNTVIVGGGANVIDVGGSNATILILGVDGSDGATYSDPDALGGGAVSSSSKDTVTIAGSGSVVDATYENVTVKGSRVTASSVLELGNGNDSVTLGGNSNGAVVGDGRNIINFSGANNMLQVTSTAGTPGTDTVDLGSNDGNTVNLSFAGGSVTGSGNGNSITTVTQDPIATTNLTVSLSNAVGQVTLGTGNDSVTANGNGSMVNIASSASPGGNDTVTAGGTAETVNIFAKTASQDSVFIGSHDQLNITGGVNAIMGTGKSGAGDSNDNFYLNNVQNGSSVTVFGNSTMVFLGSDSSAKVTLGGAASKDTITVQADSSSGNYAGTVEISGCRSGQTIDFQGLAGSNGEALTSASAVFDNTNALGGTATINLSGGGKIILDNFTSFQLKELLFSDGTGPVGLV